MRVIKEGDEFQNGKSGRIPSVAMKGVRKYLRGKKMLIFRREKECVSV